MQEAVKRVEAEEISPLPPEPLKDIEIDLRKPLQAHGETVRKLVFRRPSAGDIMQIGERWPVNINWDTGQVTPNASVMMTVMSLLAAVPPSTIKAMDANDFTDAAYGLMRFFVPDAQRTQS